MRGARATPTSEDVRSDTADPLFGSGIRAAGGWARHDGASFDLGFWPVARRLPRLLRLALGLAWRADRRLLLSLVCAQLIASAGTAVALLAVNRALAALLTAGTAADRVTEALPALIVLGVVNAARSGLSALGQAATGALGPKIDRIARVELLTGVVGVELATVRDGEFQNLVSSARRGASAGRELVQNAVSLCESLLAVIAAAGVVAALHPILLPLLVAAVVPAGWAAERTARARYVSMKVWMDVSRQLNLLDDLMTGRLPAEEVRVHQLGDFLLAHYRRLSVASEAEQARLARREARTNLLADALTGLAVVGTYGLLGVLLYQGVVPLAVVGTVTIALRTTTANLRTVVVGFNGLYEQGLFVLDWQRVCQDAASAATPTSGAPAPSHPATLTAADVSFTYPGTSTPALDGVDVRVSQGEVVALVGVNGSGKTTLARLLTGLYQPDKGTVAWDGTPIERFDRATVYSRVAFLCQDFMRWPFTARANVTIGRVDPGSDAPDPDRLDAAALAGQADLVAADLPHGWDSLLAPEFWGGVDLSGGQWQRLALARVWYRDAPIVVCDEPTAALDPRTEIEVFDRVMNLADGQRTVLLITHRLASVRRADRIYVLDAGRVVEHGSHQDLLAANGQYATMYRLQARQYEP